MENLFRANLSFLKDKHNETFASIGLAANCSANTVSNWIHKNFEPKMSELEKIAQYFEILIEKLLYTDLQNLDVNGEEEVKKNMQNLDVILDRNLDVTTKKEHKTTDFTITVAGNTGGENGDKSAIIPITDIAVAAGGGYFNGDHIENVEYLRMPVQFLKRNATYLCVQIKGISMAPTLQDGGYVIIRLLDRGEWAKMPDERLFVVSDKEGKSYLKRVKNRFKTGFIVLRSDSPDKSTYPTFNLTENEINTIWYVEWYFSAKMPNIHDQYYTRLQQLEDKVDELATRSKKM